MNAPGLLYNPDFKYQPRYPFGNDGTLQVVSYAASEVIPLGVLVQALPNGTCRVARDTTRLVGISIFDPDRHDPNTPYQPNEMVPVVRKGDAFVQYFAAVSTPVFLDKPRFNPADGTFTSDLTGTLVPHCQWSYTLLGVAVSTNF